ncbi:MAG: sialidase family protein [Paenibacillus macerans]|uniref:sialidase family protein n=1 Tax=Paenibacillus macerans TaxID=44252 RepID=UPI0022E20CF7|nr:sialidase family protein [Paenibacillus macerans]MDU7476595.1 sialidase family protein [Paenibacillus macerans]MEC0333951.1 exo-alpha-sialidase [Paenibacillus macerans]
MFKKIEKELIMNGEKPFACCHASHLAVLEGGDALAVWFAGSREGADDTAIWGARRSGGVWSEPGKLADEPDEPCWNPVLLVLESGEIILFYKAGRLIKEWRTLFKRSADGGRTWTMAAELVPGDRGGRGPVRNKAIVLADGAWLAPASTEDGLWRAFTDRSDDRGRSWRRSGWVGIPGIGGEDAGPAGGISGSVTASASGSLAGSSGESAFGAAAGNGGVPADCSVPEGGVAPVDDAPLNGSAPGHGAASAIGGAAPASDIPVSEQSFYGRGVIQPSLWESRPGEVHMLLRSTEGQIYRSDSPDGGLTWSEAYPTGLPNNNSGLDVARLDDGTLVLCSNPVGANWGPRTPLTLDISRDNGLTWRREAVLEDGEGEYSYPALIVHGGILYLTYTWNRENIAFVRLRWK